MAVDEFSLNSYVIGYINDTILSEHWPNAELMLVQRLRRWLNIKATLYQSVMFAEREFGDYIGAS